MPISPINPYRPQFSGLALLADAGQVMLVGSNAQFIGRDTVQLNGRNLTTHQRVGEISDRLANVGYIPEPELQRELATILDTLDLTLLNTSQRQSEQDRATAFETQELPIFKSTVESGRYLENNDEVAQAQGFRTQGFIQEGKNRALLPANAPHAARVMDTYREIRDGLGES